MEIVQMCDVAIATERECVRVCDFAMMRIALHLVHEF